MIDPIGASAGAMPLDGIRVIDAATVVAGPGIAARLSDFGADVIKVEHPVRGDSTRSLGWEVDGVTLWWKWIGRNKRPVGIDLSKPSGAGLLLRLVETADVLIESFRPGTFERWGLGPGTLFELRFPLPRAAAADSEEAAGPPLEAEVAFGTQ